ncbi:MAG: DUF6259 domain-containing protein [Kiritimatiellae bacterium]|nr:DUF6259 domain-containing protein [Kiritimatiellia bacterium]
MRKLLVGVCGFVTSCAFAAPVLLENEAMAIRFSSAGSGFAVESIVNKVAGGAAFLSTGPKVSDFWEIQLTSDGGVQPRNTVRLQNHTPSRERLLEQVEGGYAFVWKGLSIPGGEKEAVDVRAEVRLPPGSAQSLWTISVENRSAKWALKETHYPCLRGVVKSGQADVLMPFKNLGARLHKAYDTEKGAVGTFGYPGWYPMVAAYLQGEAGLYVAAHDPDGRNKSIVFGRGASVEFLTPVENSGCVGKAAEGPRYPVAVSVFKGDWWTAAHLYRDWALKQKWCAKGMMARRPDFPKAAAETDLWILGNGGPSSVSNQMVKARAALPGLDLAFHWYGWNVQPFDTHYPEFLAQAGVRGVSAWMNDVGIRPMPYLNGRIWDQSLASAPYARVDACAKPDGTIQRERYANRDFAVMCPWTAGWRRTLVYNATNTVVQTSAGALYYDQITCSRPQLCFNPSHGHPLGGGSWWAEGYRQALQPIHAALSAKGIPLTSEGTAESWIDDVDALLNWTTPEADDVPFYPAVYSGYTVYFGTPVQGWDSPETLWALETRALLWGVAPGWVGHWTFNKGREDYARNLLAIGRVRHAARDFLAWGTLEGPLRFSEEVKTVPVTWKVRKGKTEDFVVRTAEFPGVQGTWWRDATGGRTALVVANFAARPNAVSFVLPQGVTALVPRAIEGQPTVAARIGAEKASLTLAPHQIAVLEVR